MKMEVFRIFFLRLLAFVTCCMILIYILAPSVLFFLQNVQNITEYFYIMHKYSVSPLSHLALAIVISLYFYLHYSHKIRTVEHKFELEKANLESKLGEQYVTANTDHVTGVPIQGVFNEHLKQKLDAFNRDATVRSQFNVILIDLKNFKKINDQYGLQKGDYFLKELAQLVSESIRKSENIYRHIDSNNGLYRAYKTGDEFLIMLYGAEMDALSFLYRLKTKVLPAHSPKFGRLVGEPAFQPQFYAAVKQIYPGDSQEIVMEMLNEMLVLAKKRNFDRDVVWASKKTDGDYEKFVKEFGR